MREDDGGFASPGFFRSRLIPALVWLLLLWPALSILAAAKMLGEQPLTGIVKWPVRVSGLTATAFHLWPELLASAVILIVADVLFWGALCRWNRGGVSRWADWLEPPLFLLMLSTGIVTIYPAALRHPLFRVLRDLPVFLVLALFALGCLLAAAVLGWVRTRKTRSAFAFSGAALLIIIASSLVTASPFRPQRQAVRDSILLLGLDSLAQTQNLSILREMAESPSWTWYEHPVTPGLLTNSVWPSILMNRLPHETGCFLIFQDPNWERSPYNMVEEAEKRGYETWSFFSDQFTTYVGSNGGFDVDRSGPKGWLQAASSVYKDATVVMPVLLARLPRIPFAKTPRNQSGTFSYDLRREIDEIVTAGDGGERLFVAAHLDYLHQPAYPGLHELRKREALKVLRAPSRSIRDLSLHWQYPPLRGEPLGLYGWKLRRLQRVVARAVQDHDLVDSNRGNRLALFSDHGPRMGITVDNFSAKQGYKVLLVTNGMERRDPGVPISLLELHRLAGLPDASRPNPAPQVVEYTNVRGNDEHLVLMRSAVLKRDGEVALHPYIVARFGQRLLAYFPHEAHRGYVRVPSVPAEMDRLPESERIPVE